MVSPSGRACPHPCPVVLRRGLGGGGARARGPAGQRRPETVDGGAGPNTDRYRRQIESAHRVTPATRATPCRSALASCWCREVDHCRATDGQHDSQNQPTLFNDDKSEEHTSELQSPCNLVCRLLLEKK